MSHDTQDLVIAVFCHLAKENDKSVENIIHLLLVVQKKDLAQRFWDIIDEALPGHHFESVRVLGKTCKKAQDLWITLEFDH